MEEKESNWLSMIRDLLCEEISQHSRYFDATIQVQALAHDDGGILRGLQCRNKSAISSPQDIPPPETESRRLFLLNGNFNHDYDVEGMLREFHARLGRGDRITAIVYNSYLRWLYALATELDLRHGEMPTTYLTRAALENVAKLAGFEMVRTRSVGFIPFPLFGAGAWLNRFLQALPFFRWFGLAGVVMLRPVKKSGAKPSLSILIPARNERGNIEAAINRLPDFGGAKVELIFVEGHSTDATWGEIQIMQTKYRESISIQAIQQTGTGKANAVREGLAHAKNDLVTILDADLTMPPELLSRFYEAYENGLGDFVNGNRLIYPMEGEAMRFLNWLGNLFFARALSFVLDARYGDTLCGTKLMARTDYQRFCDWRNDFGDFDPFGDFELLFPAALLGLGSVDIPVRYRARVYGTTNIRRFRDGWVLLRMTLLGLWRIRFAAHGGVRKKAP